MSTGSSGCADGTSSRTPCAPCTAAHGLCRAGRCWKGRKGPTCRGLTRRTTRTGAGRQGERRMTGSTPFHQPQHHARSATATEDPPSRVRARERAMVAAAVDGLDTSGPVLVTLSGRSGLGQSALVRWTADRAHASGHRVLRARAALSESELPYGVVTQLLEPLDVPPISMRATPPGPTRPEPFPGLAGLLRAARECPTVLAVEDAHWLDRESLHWLQALLRRSAGGPLAVVCGGDDAAAADPGWPGELGSAPGPVAHHLTLAPLPPDEVAAEVARVCGPADEAFTAEAARISGGHPAVLHDLLQRFAALGHRPAAARLPALRATGSAVLGDHLISAVRGLGAEAGEVVRVLAVCGHLLDFPLVRTLARAGSLNEHRLRAALARTAGIRALPDGRLRVEPALRVRVLEDMTADDRTDLHVRAAELAHRAGAEDRAVADLLLAARPTWAAWAVHTLRRDADHAVREGEHDRAAVLLARAAEEERDPAERARLGLELAAVHLVTEPEAGDLRIERLIRTPENPAAVRLHAADLGLTGGGAEVVRRSLADALTVAAGAERDDLLALFWAADPTGQGSGVPSVPTVPPLPQRPATRAQAAVRAWQLALYGESLYEVRSLAQAALTDDQRPGGPLIQPALAACRALCLTDALDDAESGLNRLLGALDGSRLRLAAPQILALRGELNIRRGRLAQAERDLEAAERGARLLGRSAALLPHLYGIRIVVDVESGREDAARERAAMPLPSAAEDSEHWPRLLFARGVVALRGGNPVEARDQFRECGRRLLSRHHLNPVLVPWRSLTALTCHTLGESAEARRLSEQELALARRWGAGSTLAWAKLTAVLVAGREDRLAGIRSAMGAVRSAPTGPEYARVLAEYTALEMTESGGDRRMAALSLAELCALTAAHPSAPMAVRARALAGAATGTVSVPGWCDLSEAERQSALLAGRGRSNRDIAALLEISSRAVELRLARAYRKLRINGRQELRELVRAMEGH
ncbi:AAA family ATPase [Streptomyces sp. NPDC056817]|uniref:AAA family ATPase n=2 Tax=unclassified Streptomyces TaxID=2593676 RepID=UPI00367DF4D3